MGLVVMVLFGEGWLGWGDGDGVVFLDFEEEEEEVVRRRR